MIYLTLVYMLISFAIAVWLTPLVKRIALQKQILDHPSEVKIHEQPIPRSGGLAIVSAFFISLLLFLGFKIETRIWLLILAAAVIIAVGAKAYKPVGYLYGQDERIMTSHELDVKLMDQQSPVWNSNSAVFIQCVGSRNKERPYCSKVCCTHTVETALSLKERNPDNNIYVLYRDIRTFGFNENLYQQARSKGVIFIRYNEDERPEVRKNEYGGLEVIVTDHVLGQKVSLKADFVCLATAIVPNAVKDLARQFKVPLNSDGFFLEAHMKLRPVDFATEGVFVAGLAHYPKPLDEAIAQAKATASRASTILTKKEITVSGAIANINENKCAGCGLCLNICAYNAIEMNEKGKAKVKEALCKGCGSCVAGCRMGAPELYGLNDEQILSVIEAM